MEAYQHRSGRFTAFDGKAIFYQVWASETTHGLLIIAHGVGEHSGRYGPLIRQLQGKGVSVYALDHRGHGQSEGKRGHIKAFSDYIKDLSDLVEISRQHHPQRPVILLGHSMGGVMALHYALEKPQAIQGLILSSAGLIPIIPASPCQQGLGKLLSMLAPSVLLSNGLDTEMLSHDPDMVKQYRNDPLVHDKVSVRWFTEFIRAGQNALERAESLQMPLFIMHGKSDAIVDYRGSVLIMERAQSVDKTLHLFEGLYHETMNETLEQREQVLTAVEDWIIRQISR